MAKIIFSVAGDERAQQWVDAFKKQSAAHDYILWTPETEPTGADFAIVWQPDMRLFAQEPQLQAVFNLGAGVDALQINEAFPAHLPVYRIEDGGMALQMAEFAFYGLLLATRRFAAYAAQQKDKNWHRQPPVYARDWPIGVMGYGQIGAHVAKVFAQLGYPVAVWTRSPRQGVPEIDYFHGAGQLESFLNRTRLLVNVLPLTAQTRGIINAQSLAALQADGFLVNMARGAHVVDADLLAALDSGQLRGALLDVFEVEPLPGDHPFWTHPDIHVTPHIAGYSLREDCAEQILDKISQIERGETPSGRVDPALGY